MDLSVSRINQTLNAYAPVSGFNAPNWEIIPHNGMEAPPKAELIKQIKESGVKYARATSDVERDKILNEQSKLHAQYLSLVSPDRKALYRDAMQVIGRFQPSAKQKPLQRIKTIYDFLNERDGIDTERYDLTHIPEPLPNGGSVSASNLAGGGYCYFIQSCGINVMSTVDQEWHYSMTPAETAKNEEFYMIFNSAVGGERYKMKLETSSQNAHPDTFEAKA